VGGATIQRLQIPIAYAPKEKWLVRIEQDPTLENHTYVSLPRMSFEITGYNYDPSRKLNKMNKIICNDGSGSSTMYSPVPYNVEVSLYILTKTQEDGLQIIEQVLPTFTPEYVLSINAVPEMNIVQDIPVTLNSINVNDEYDGDFETRRFVTHTLTFTLKLNLFGSINQSSQIHKVEANVSAVPDMSVTAATFTARGNPETFEIDEEGWDHF
jgi:hypothetical protein